MRSRLARREFLKTAPAAAGLLAAATKVSAWKGAQTAAPDYPIRPLAYSEVTLRDAFWKPKVDTNAAVTIPLEFRKAAEDGRLVSQNVLQAAIYSIRTHPDPRLLTDI